jgi:succinate dehydrogenase / fumarate reductase cytochrome b subunit
MNPLSAYFGSSVGRKQVMGLSGVYLYAFLLVHLVGNIGLLSGSEYFNGYAHLMLSTLGKIVVPIEFTLLAAFVIHLYLGFKLTSENRAARPERYAVKASKGKRHLYRGWMFLTGSWILVFVLVHVPHFRFGVGAESPVESTDGEAARFDLYAEVMRSFASPLFTLFYVFSFALLFTHLAHGVQSSLQSLGLNHPRHNRWINAVSIAYAAVICGGFAALAVWAHFKGASL